jgi:hypothetical protein
MKSGELRNVLRVASTVLRWSTVPVGVAWLWVWLAIVRGPLSPDPATQRVVPVPNHGHDVYVTPLQDNLLHWLIPVGITLVIVGRLANWLSEKWASSTKK